MGAMPETSLKAGTWPCGLSRLNFGAPLLPSPRLPLPCTVPGRSRSPPSAHHLISLSCISYISGVFLRAENIINSLSSLKTCPAPSSQASVHVKFPCLLSPPLPAKLFQRGLFSSLFLFATTWLPPPLRPRTVPLVPPRSFLSPYLMDPPPS